MSRLSSEKLALLLDENEVEVKKMIKRNCKYGYI